MSLLHSGYPVRVAKLVIVDANFVARTAIRSLKMIISKKLGNRLITVHSSDLAEHLNVKELPPYFGEGENSEGAVAYHARNAARQKKLDAALYKSYGYKFESIPSDMTKWIEVANAPPPCGPPAVEEDESNADDDAPHRNVTTI